MSDVAIDPYIPPAETDLNNSLDQVLTKLGISLGSPSTGTPVPPPSPAQQWAGAVNQLRAAWPGYPWPATFNAETVDILFSDVLGRLGMESQYLYFQAVALQAWVGFLNHAVTVLETDVSALESTSGSAVSGSALASQVAYIERQIAGVTTYAEELNGLINQAFAQVVGQERADVAQLWTGLAEIQGLVGTAFAQAVGQERADVAALSTDIAEVQGLVGAVNANLSAQIAATSTQLQGQIDNVSTVLEGGIVNETSRATAAENGIVNQSIPAAMLATLTQVEAKLAPIRTEVQTCLDPMCDTVAPRAKQLGNLGRLLKGLEDLGIAAVLAGLVAFAIAEPESAATDVVDVGGWMTGFAVELVDAVMG